MELPEPEDVDEAQARWARVPLDHEKRVWSANGVEECVRDGRSRGFHTRTGKVKMS